MSTSFPGSADSFTDTTPSEYLGLAAGGIGISQVLNNHNDAIEAVEAKVGISASTPTAGKVLRATGIGSSAWGQVDVTTDVAGFTSANLRTLLSDETGTGAAVFGTSPTLSSPTLTSPTLTSPVITSPSITWDGWSPLGYTPNAVTANGNRSYDVTFNSVDLTSTLSNGMRLKMTRTVPGPTQCTSLNGTTQYYSKTSPAGMTFTDDFTVSAWVRLSSYATGSIASRFNGTSGWDLQIASTGQVILVGLNGGAANYSNVSSYQSIPLNKWVHVAAQLDMSTFTATTTTSYIMFNGVDVPALVARGGTNPTALIQAGNLEIGSRNAGNQFFPGKIDQAAIYNAKVTQATILASMNQTLSGSETSLISAYSFNNSINDLSANANNLTANGSAVATNADSPFGAQGDGTVSSTLEYGIITKTAFSTNTTVTVQVPEGGAIPTSGGVGAVSYSTQKVPYLFPSSQRKWELETINKTNTVQSSPVAGTWYNIASIQLWLPVGEWAWGYTAAIELQKASQNLDILTTISTGAASETDTLSTSWSYVGIGTAAFDSIVLSSKQGTLSVSTAAAYYLNEKVSTTGGSAISTRGDGAPVHVYARNAYL